MHFLSVNTEVQSPTCSTAKKIETKKIIKAARLWNHLLCLHWLENIYADEYAVCLYHAQGLKKKNKKIKTTSRIFCPKLPFSRISSTKKKSKNNSKKSRNSSTSGHPELSKSVTSSQSKSPVWGFNEIKDFSLSKYFVV